MKKLGHLGQPRQLLRKRIGQIPPEIQAKDSDFFSFNNFPLIRKVLTAKATGCKHRKATGTYSNAPCCRSEGGQVFHCTLYGHSPARLFDCLNCQKQIALKNREPWISPLLQLSKGQPVNAPLKRIQELVIFSDGGSVNVAEKPK